MFDMETPHSRHNCTLRFSLRTLFRGICILYTCFLRWRTSSNRSMRSCLSSVNSLPRTSWTRQEAPESWKWSSTTETTSTCWTRRATTTWRDSNSLSNTTKKRYAWYIILVHNVNMSFISLAFTFTLSRHGGTRALDMGKLAKLIFHVSWAQFAFTN